MGLAMNDKLAVIVDALRIVVGVPQIIGGLSVDGGCADEV